MAENTDRNKSLQYSKNDVLSVSGEYGIVNQIALQGRSFAGVSVADYHVVETNDVVYTKSPLKANPYGIIKHNSGVPGIVSTLYAVYHPKSCAISQFIDYYFQNDLRLNKYLKPLVNIGAKHDMKINNEVALTGDVIFPSVDEQAKIVDFLKLIDEKIAKQKQLVEALKSYKRGAVQSVFSESAYRGKSAEKWAEKSIAELFDCIIDKGHPEADVLTIIQGVGTTRRDTGNRRISYDKSSVATYKRVVPNDFILHLRSFEGGLEIANETGIVSPAYTILRSKYSISPQFYYSYFRSYAFINGKLRIAVEGIRDGKSINMDTFWKIAIPFPPLEEQERFAKLFVGLDTTINKANIMLNKLDTLKRGLLSLLFI